MYNVVTRKESPCTAELCLTLEEYVEDATNYFTSDTTLLFLPGNHSLNILGFVEIINVSNLALVGVDSYTPGFKGLSEPVSRIVCSGSEFWNSGIAIINATNLHIESLSFSKCGTFTILLENELLNVRNKSAFVMGGGLKAALALISIHSLIVVNVTVEKSLGYGLLGINILGGSIKGASFIENNLYTYDHAYCSLIAGSYCHISRCIGGNTLLVFEDHTDNECKDTCNSYKLEVGNSKFFHGISVCELELGYLQAVGGLGVFFGQSSFGIEVDIYNASFEGNSAPLGGNVHIEFHGSVNNSSIKLRETYLGYGNSIFHFPHIAEGGGIYLIYIVLHGRSISHRAKVDDTQQNAFIMSECEIVHGAAKEGAGMHLVIIGTDNPRHIFSIFIENSLFSDNIGLNGVAVFIKEYQTSPFVNLTRIMFSNTKFINNHFVVDDEKLFPDLPAQLGTVWALSIPYLTFENCRFDHNELSGLAAWGSNIIFSGENNFVSNRGYKGGGMGLSQTTLYLLPDSTIHFIGNHALQRGGGIYVDSSQFDLLSSYFFQIHDPNHSTQVKVSVTFQNNSAAKSGTSLYGGLIDSCFLQMPSPFLGIRSSEVVD